MTPPTKSTKPAKLSRGKRGPVKQVKGRISKASQKDDRPIGEIITEIMKDVSEETLQRLPVDGASEHDHYIYGTPKKRTCGRFF